jgi:hypothetical protein
MNWWLFWLVFVGLAAVAYRYQWIDFSWARWFIFMGIFAFYQLIRAALSYKPEHVRVGGTGVTLLGNPDRILGNPDRFVPFDEIRHVKFYYQVTRTRVNANLELTVEGKRRPLRIAAGPTPRRKAGPFGERISDGSYGEGDSAALLSDYKRICSGSFETRCAHYVQEIRRNGFLRYDGKQFYLDGEVLFSDGSINLTTMFLQREPFALKCGHRRIRTLVDIDVFFWLLERSFGITIAANGVVRVKPAGIPTPAQLSWLREHDDAAGHGTFDSMFGEGAAERYMKPKTGR